MKTPTVIEGPSRKYTLKTHVAEGDLTDVYFGSYANGGGDNDVVVKITKHVRDNDLTTNEAAVLSTLFPADQPDGEPTFNLYIPRCVDSFVTRVGGEMRVNVFARLPKDPNVSLDAVLRAYPKGVNFRDMVWMYKRMLVALGYAHTKGIIHGAVLPPHVLIHEESHGAKLIDWSYALNFAALVKPKAPDPKTPATKHKPTNAWEKLLEGPEYDPDPVRFMAPQVAVDPNAMYVKAISVAYENFYAPEVLTKKTPTPATDLYMAAKVAVALLGGDVETNQIPDTSFEDPAKQRVPFQAFLSSSLLQDARKRPWDAWDLHESFDKLMLGLVGKPKYHPFSMPPTN